MMPSSDEPIEYVDDLTLSEHLSTRPDAAWGQTNCLTANALKTKDMVIIFRKPQNRWTPPPVVLNGKAVERVETFKLLGVQLSYDLSWDAQVRYVLKRSQARSAGLQMF